MEIEYYVYELSTKYNDVGYNATIKLTRLNKDTFKVELLHVSPDNYRVFLESKFERMNWTVKLLELSGGKGYVLYFSEELFPLYVSPELIKLGCEKASEIEKLVKEYINPYSSPEARSRFLQLLSKPTLEVNVNSFLVGDLYNSVGLHGLLHFLVTHYDSTATCRGSVYTFNQTLKAIDTYTHRVIQIDASSRYSSTGWLVYARQVEKFVIEEKLVETSNKDLSHALQIPIEGLQVIEDLLANPLAIAIAVTVVVVVVIALRIVKAKM